MGTAEKPLIDRYEHRRVLIGRPPQHDPADMGKVRFRFAKRPDPAIDDDRQIRPRSFEPVNPLIVERRQLAVFFRAETAQPGFARVNDEGVAARCGDGLDETGEIGLAVLIVDADPAFYRYRHANCGTHGRDAFGDEPRLGHQAGAEPARLHAVGRAADIEIDFVIAETLADLRGRCKLSRIAAADLQRDRVLRGIETNQLLALAMNDRGRRHHLGIEPRMARELAVEIAAMPVCPLHHRRDAESVFLKFHHFSNKLIGLVHEHAHSCPQIFAALRSCS